MDASQITAALAGYLTAAEASARLKITLRAVQTACQRGQLPGAILLGREWRIPPAAVDFRLSEFGKGQIPQKMRPNPGRKPKAEKDLRKSRKKSPKGSKNLLRRTK
jgi:excisionase family DNA binding protein